MCSTGTELSVFTSFLGEQVRVTTSNSTILGELVACDLQAIKVQNKDSLPIIIPVSQVIQCQQMPRPKQ